MNRTTTNYSFTEERDEKVSFPYEKMSEERFYSSHSWKVFEPSSVEVTAIPRLILTTEIGMEKSGNNNVEWSIVNRETQTQERSVKVTIPPRSQTFTVTQGYIDVPYSYKQRDIHIDGDHETRILEDGVFTGFNTIVDYVVTDPLPLPRTYASHLWRTILMVVTTENLIPTSHHLIILMKRRSMRKIMEKDMLMLMILNDLVHHADDLDS